MGLLDIFKFGSSKPKVQPTTPHKPIILVVDDDEYLRDFYAELLAGEGYAIVTATNGQEAIASVAQNHPDVILLDIMMPIMDGNQVLEQLSKNEETKKTPIIVLTNAGNIDNIDTAKFYKAFKFFIKSNVPPEEIIACVKDAVGTSAMKASNFS